MPYCLEGMVSSVVKYAVRNGISVTPSITSVDGLLPVKGLGPLGLATFLMAPFAILPLYPRVSITRISILSAVLGTFLVEEKFKLEDKIEILEKDILDIHKIKSDMFYQYQILQQENIELKLRAGQIV